MESTSYPLIRLCDVTKSWDGHETLSNVNIEVNKGDFILVTGPNGGGKTTLLKLLLKLTRPTSGTVAYLTPEGLRTSLLSIGYLPQKSAVDSRFPITVREVVASGLLGSKNTADKETLISEAISRIGLSDMAQRALGELSGGQVQRALLARAIVSHPTVLVLDEPMSYLDSRYREVATDILKDMKADGTTIIVVSHDPQTLIGLADIHLSVDRTACRMQP